MTDPLATSFALRPGVSFCRVGKRAVFLDVGADRYFCLSPIGEAAFVKLEEGQTLDRQDVAALCHLARQGPLVPILDGRANDITPCAAAEPPIASLLDEICGRAALVEQGCAAFALLNARLRLRFRGLRASLRHLQRRKSGLESGGHPGAAIAVATAFDGLRAIATETDNCLTRSIAIAERLASVGAVPVMKIAVKLQPFAAHAWVESDGYLVNDRHDFVRDYTPIFVL